MIFKITTFPYRSVNRRWVNYILLSISLSLIPAEITYPAGNWNQWGGPNRDFSIQDESIRLDWDSTGPGELWSRELGSGNSGLAVDPYRLVAHFRSIDADGTISQNESIMCIKKESGQTLWTYDYPSTKLNGQEEYGGGIGPHATPLIVDDKVISLGYAGQVHCLDLTNGGVLWKTHLVEDHAAAPVQFGFASSPLAYDSLIILQCAGRDSGLIALNRLTGEKVWSSQGATPGYASPVVTNINNQKQILFSSGDTVQGIHPADGSVLWSYKFRRPGLTNVPTPMEIGSQKFLISGQGIGGTEVIELAGRADGFKTKSLWNTSRVTFFDSNMVRMESLIFGGESFLYCVDTSNGKKLWTERGIKSPNSVVVNGQLLSLTRDGLLIVASPDRKSFNEMSRTQLLTGNCWTPPSLDGGVLYARNRSMLAAFDLKKPKRDQSAAPSSETYRNFALALERLSSIQFLEWVRSRDAVDPDFSLDQFLVAASRQWMDNQDASNAYALIQFGKSISPESTRLLDTEIFYWLKTGNQLQAKESAEKHPQCALSQMILNSWKQPDNTGKTVFELEGFASSRSVSIAGTFNNWDKNQYFLEKKDNKWKIAFPLASGEYQYKYIVDDKWIADPGNKSNDKSQNNNSIINVP